jgi:AraC-like DNA-binding protein
MEKDIIKNISIEDFKTNKNFVDYIDDDFLVANSLENIPYSNDAVRLNCFLLISCIEGCIQLDMNNKTYQLQNNDIIFGLPSVIISHIMLSPKHKISILGFSTHFLQRIFKIGKDTWNTATYLHNNPIKHVGENKYIIFQYYKDLVMSKISSEPHPYHKESMKYLFSSILCDIIAIITKEIPQEETENKQKNGIKQNEYIFRRFIEKLAADNGMHRSVSYYADALFYSPKYLSKVIKDACGRNPLDLINEHAMEHIKYKLRNSDKSIKEIAEEFNFSNQSFFGKYVKAHLGVSPQQYRAANKK